MQQQPPVKLLEDKSDSNKIRKYCSFDGDADRIVYYYLSGNEKSFHLLDGDKISTLTAIYLKDLVKNSDLLDQLKLCIVQTAYANGSSTSFIEDFMVIIFIFFMFLIVKNNCVFKYCCLVVFIVIIIIINSLTHINLNTFA